MENKKSIPIIALVVFSIVLLFSFDYQKAYALTLSSFAITGTPNQMQKVGNTMFTLASSTGAYRVINLLTETETASATLTIDGTTFKGFRCNSTDCWILSVTGTTNVHIQRFTASTGAEEEAVNLARDGAGNSDLGLSTTTIYFGMKCTTGDIGSSGAGDTDLAVFSLDGNSMAGSPVQHSDCGSNFSPISTASEGLIGYKVTSDGSRLAVITNGNAVSDIFNWVSLTQTLTSSNNPVLCEVTMSGASFTSANGRNIQLLGNKGYVNINSGGDTFNISTVTSTCGLTVSGAITAFNTAQATIVLDSANDIFYMGGIEADGAGNTVRGYNFANDVITTTLILQVFPDASETSNLGMEFTSSINTVYLGSTTTIYVIDFGGAEPPTGNEEFCANPANVNILICRLESIDGTALGSASQSIGNSTNDIFIQIGLVEEGSDIQTNGVGYMLVALGLALMIVMFYLGSGGELGKIPTFVWVLGALMVIGGLTGFGFVDSTFFIIAILVIIALASTKILSALERF